ncbi:MAG: aminotransferase class V-fold PLP-dependent enzyme [Malacoplasma sp.]
MIYLDNAATTYPKPEEVYKYIDYLNRNYSFNAGRGSYKKAQEVSKMIEETRKLVSKVVNSSTTIFSSSATFAMNQIIYGLELNEFSNVYYSPYEHNAVMRTLQKRCDEVGFNMIEMPIKPDSLSIDLEKLSYMYAKNNPSVVFCIHVSNVTGYILPIESIGLMSKNYQSIYIVDAAQSFSMIPIDMVKMKIDYVVFAGHKTLYSCFGIGGICCNTQNKLKVYFVGGTGSNSLNLEMPSNSIQMYEPSSPNAVAIISISKSLEWINNNAKLIMQERELYSYFINRLKLLPNVIVYVDDSNEYFGVVSINVYGYKAEDIGMILDEDYDICVRSGYHCAPIIHKYLKDESYYGTVRVGLSLFTTKADLDTLLKCLQGL